MLRIAAAARCGSSSGCGCFPRCLGGHRHRVRGEKRTVLSTPWGGGDWMVCATTVGAAPLATLHGSLPGKRGAKGSSLGSKPNLMPSQGRGVRYLLRRWP